jgi:hypothetical protein
MDKVVLWTDLVGSLQQGAKGPQWIIRDSHLQKWSLNINKKNKSSGYDLIFTYKVNNSWIPNPGNPITIAHVGARDRLEVSVMEGVEERILSIDCKKHPFKGEGRDREGDVIWNIQESHKLCVGDIGRPQQ